jgi:hypothetical protein
VAEAALGVEATFQDDSMDVGMTEIEAIKTMTNARAVPVGAGGIGGAEGAVWLAVFGSSEELQRVESLVDSLRKEPSFL